MPRLHHLVHLVCLEPAKYLRRLPRAALRLAGGLRIVRLHRLRGRHGLAEAADHQEDQQTDQQQPDHATAHRDPMMAPGDRDDDDPPPPLPPLPSLGGLPSVGGAVVPGATGRIAGLRIGAIGTAALGELGEMTLGPLEPAGPAGEKCTWGTAGATGT